MSLMFLLITMTDRANADADAMIMIAVGIILVRGPVPTRRSVIVTIPTKIPLMLPPLNCRLDLMSMDDVCLKRKKIHWSKPFSRYLGVLLERRVWGRY
jgi:hypothetical protein